jgi:hypothetical protein
MTDAPRPIRADALRGVPHGFFTREGGVSRGLHAGLNCGLGSEDDPAAVAENRRRVAAALGAGALLTGRQVHGDRALPVSGPWPDARPEADALVTATPGIAVGVLTADCAPVLLSDRAAGVVGAAHAGWRGALDGILESALAAMERLGAERGRIAAAVGPTIRQAAYEVGPKFVARFLDDDPETARFFAGGSGDRALFDLSGYVCARLRAAGVEAAWTGHCTHSDPARFYSHRRARRAGEPDYGRLVAAIAVAP